MADRKTISIDEALQSSKIKTYEEQDKKEKPYKRKTTQISIYLPDDEIKYLDEKCEETFLARNAYMRKLLVDEMRKKKDIK